MKPSSIAYINKIEPLATFDGPGIRTLFFLSGCPLRCLYCHNPETWQYRTGREMDVEELIHFVKRNEPYYAELGGVTFSGGEPLGQADFLNEVLPRLQEEGIHTTLDTSGFSQSPYLENILKHCDLVIFDIKAADSDLYKRITSRNMDVSLDFINLAQKVGTKLWIRQVVVPGINNNFENIDETAKMIAGLKNVEKIELLPYHTLGVTKYEKMNVKYPLEGVKAMERTEHQELEALLFERIAYYKEDTEKGVD